MPIEKIQFDQGADVTERRLVTEVMEANKGYSTKEIADLLGVHQASARQRLIRAFEKNEVQRKKIEGKTYWARSN